jgi:hypothetical protein
MDCHYYYYVTVYYDKFKPFLFSYILFYSASHVLNQTAYMDLNVLCASLCLLMRSWFAGDWSDNALTALFPGEELSVSL